MKVIETHFVQAEGELRKVYKLDRLTPTYIMERINSNGDVLFHALSEENFRETTNALANRFYRQENPEEK